MLPLCGLYLFQKRISVYIRYSNHGTIGAFCN